MKKKLSLITLLSLICGSIFGLFINKNEWLILNIEKIHFLGTIYITILKYLIFPVIFSSIVISIYESHKYKGRLFFKTVLLFIVMFVISFLLSSLVIWIIDPTKMFEKNSLIPLSSYMPVVIDFEKTNFFNNILPKDIKGFFEGKYLFFVIIISYICGYLSYLLKLKWFIDILNKLKKYLFKILEYLTYYAPIAVFSLMAYSTYLFGINTLLHGIIYIITAYLSGLVVIIIVMILPLKIIGINIKELIKRIYHIWTITLATCSSAATLPYTINLCKEDLKIKEGIVDAVVPLGCTIHMCGGAVSFSLLGLFCAKLFGIEINIQLFLMMILTATLLNMAAPGIPGGGIVIGTSYLQTLGIPLDFIYLYNGIYKILDMLYTSLNVTGDIVACILISKDHIDE